MYAHYYNKTRYIRQRVLKSPCGQVLILLKSLICARVVVFCCLRVVIGSAWIHTTGYSRICARVVVYRCLRIVIGSTFIRTTIFNI